MGQDGVSGRDAEPRPMAPKDPAAADLLAAAKAALRARGRVPGLSYFSDVIESVRV